VRGLETVGLRERDIKVINTSDADIVGAFAAPGTTATVAWKPQLAQIVSMPNASEVFDSSRIPGEIMDLFVVNTATLKANPKFGMALIGAWYETLAIVFGKDPRTATALASMAKASGTDLAGFNSQLATTNMFVTPTAAVSFTSSPNLIRIMDLVRTFSFNHGLLGQGARSADVVGMAFAGGKTLGNPQNVKLRFDPSYMQLAADGRL
jgi:NitT/TauT family transport system substrate-binding protein